MDVLEKRPDGLIVVQNKPEMGSTVIGSAFKTSIEPDLAHPFVRWEDIHRFSWHTAHCILVTQDPATKKGIEESKLKAELPHTFDYLKRYEKPLRSRSGYRKYFHSEAAFYTVYNVSKESFSPIKVVWKTMVGNQIEAAVLTEIEVPGLPRKVPFHKNTVMFISVQDLEEAHYLSALLNSVCVTFIAKSFAVSGGKGSGATNLLQYVSIPAFRAAEPIHEELARLSKQGHELALELASHPSNENANRRLVETEDEIDRAAAKLWGLTDAELAEIRKALDLLQ